MAKRGRPRRKISKDKNYESIVNEILERYGLYKKELANYLGSSTKAIDMWINGRRVPTKDNEAKLEFFINEFPKENIADEAFFAMTTKNIDSSIHLLIMAAKSGNMLNVFMGLNCVAVKLAVLLEDYLKNTAVVKIDTSYTIAVPAVCHIKVSAADENNIEKQIKIDVMQPNENEQIYMLNITHINKNKVVMHYMFESTDMSFSTILKRAKLFFS